MNFLCKTLISFCVMSICLSPAVGKTGGTVSRVSYSKCEGSIKSLIQIQNREACARLAESGKLTDKQRASIYFHLGVLEAFNPAGKRMDIVASLAVQRGWYAKAIAADPSLEWPYLLATENLIGADDKAAIDIAEQGTKANPNSKFLKAVLAQALFSAGKQENAIALCDTLLDTKPLDYVPATICGEIYANSKKWGQVYLAFEEANKTYDPAKPSGYGLKKRTNPASGMAFALSKQGKNREAVDLLTAYLARKDIGYDVRLVRYDRSYYYEKLGMFLEAAADLDAYAKGAGLDNVIQARISQMVDLARGGKPNDAQTIADVIYGPAPPNFILKLQVKLRNVHFDDLEFTGKFDGATRKALELCLREPTCFGEVPGQRI